MGRALAASKSKKNSEEDRRKRKNPKSRKRRRVSLLPSSSSSDADDVSRRRRSSRRKPGIRRGRDPKRSMKRSRKARRRSVSSASRDSSSSCSTCRSPSSGSLNKSRSHARGRDGRKGKLKKKVKRGRKLDRVVRSLRSRNRSLSCSTCSGSSGSSQTYGYREVENKERDGSRQIGSSSVIESRGEVDERYGSKGREIDNELIMTNYDDSQIPHANVGRDVDIVKEDRVMDEGSYEQGTEIDRWMSEANVENDSYFDQDSWARPSESYKELELNNTKLSGRIKSEIIVADKHDSESDDLELMLRQKALENLKKLRGGLSSDNRTSDDRKNELAGAESSEKQSETATKIISSPKSHSTVSKERHIQSIIPSHDSKANPIMQLSSLEPNYSASDKKTLVSRLNPNRQSPCRSSQEKNAAEGSGSGNGSLRSEVNLSDGIEKTCEVNQTVDECQNGSQFEQKTFSRMHDGETVQVSYKVYIPKKTPALARRKLQR